MKRGSISLLLGLGGRSRDLLLGKALGEDGPVAKQAVSEMFRDQWCGSHLLVLGNLDLLLLGLSALERAEVAAALETLGGDKALDLGAVDRRRVSSSR